ncbi:RluA family pseudouridine synthase [Brevibacillus daliensis]|uniref:RluA family pseudouridine synthase n=1 Tax=Brevibacillus daliensis TaxID=2892995 RepID=UPI001E482C9A|nr:RluA family pseudouridine synthase [Brevibacillus daliensis]
MKDVLLRFTIKKEQAGRKLRDVLQQDFEISRKLLIRAKYKGEILVNGEYSYVSREMIEGDQIQILLDEEESENLIPQPMDLDIRLEDEDIMIIAKKAGIVVHPSGMHVDGTLANGVVHYWQQKGEQRKFRPVSRLDKDTSGLIIVAKNQWAHERFSRMQKDKTLKRRYVAIVHGRLAYDEGVIESPIGRKEGSIIEREVRADGQQAITRYQVVARSDDMSLVKLELQTGRTHQIRVHMSYSGHPLIGDELYGGSRELLDRQALHAYELQFIHPRSKEEIRIEQSIPDDMQKIIEMYKLSE